jgi:hypothetical protein
MLTRLLKELSGRPHGAFDLPERAPAIETEPVERADLGERRQLVAANAGAGDQVL